MIAAPDPPKWVTALAALVLLIAVFLAVYAGAAFLGGLVCGVFLRFQLSFASSTCRFLPSALASVVYFAFLFGVPLWLNLLRALVTRVYRRLRRAP